METRWQIRIPHPYFLPLPGESCRAGKEHRSFPIPLLFLTRQVKEAAYPGKNGSDAIITLSSNDFITFQQYFASKKNVSLAKEMSEI